jgi:hypothetical protein
VNKRLGALLLLAAVASSCNGSSGSSSTGPTGGRTAAGVCDPERRTLDGKTPTERLKSFEEIIAAIANSAPKVFTHDAHLRPGGGYFIQNGDLHGAGPAMYSVGASYESGAKPGDCTTVKEAGVGVGTHLEESFDADMSEPKVRRQYYDVTIDGKGVEENSSTAPLGKYDETDGAQGLTFQIAYFRTQAAENADGDYQYKVRTLKEGSQYTGNPFRVLTVDDVNQLADRVFTMLDAALKSPDYAEWPAIPAYLTSLN